MPSLRPYIDPLRPKPKRRPLKAMHHMNQLLADKEDTAQVFHIIEALNGDSLRNTFQRFASTSDGQARLAARRSLAPILDDHEALGDLPSGSVGRAYIDFMKREGLTAAGLVEESMIRTADQPVYDDDLAWFSARQRDTHDMFHVLSGYGRDGLGEAALLAFTHGQNGGGFGILFIAFMGFRKMRKELPASIDLKAVWKEARVNGKAAKKIVDQDIIAMLYEPLEEVRARLSIKPPAAYRAALKAFSDLPGETRDAIMAV